MNRNWNIVKGIRVGNSINHDFSKQLEQEIKIKRVINCEFSGIVFKKEPKDIKKYFKWVKDQPYPL